MEEFLKKMKLLDSLETELDISKQEFVNRLKVCVDEGSTDAFSDMFDVFSSSKNHYKGRVDNKGFEIKKRRRFFDKQFGFAKAKGSYSHSGEKLYVKTVINGWNDFMYFFFGLISLFYVGFFFAITRGEPSYFAIVFLIFHAFLMFFIPIRMMRSSVRKIKYDLEREFHYIATKK